jgi:epsin
MNGLSEIEIKVQEATGPENWGPHGAVMAEIARASRDRDDLPLIMKTLWGRLEHKEEEWRHVYKALAIMEFLIAQGAEAVVRELRSNLREIKRLESFQYKEPSGRDQGVNVRQRSTKIITVSPHVLQLNSVLVLSNVDDDVAGNSLGPTEAVHASSYASSRAPPTRVTANAAARATADVAPQPVSDLLSVSIIDATTRRVTGAYCWFLEFSP